MQGCIHLESIRRYYVAFYWGNCFRATAHHWCKQNSATDLSEYLHCAKMMETWEALWHWGPVLSGPGLSWLTVAKQRIKKDEERGTGIIRNAIVRKSQSDSNKVAATGLLPRTAWLIQTKVWTRIILWSRHAYRLIIQFFVILRPCSTWTTRHGSLIKSVSSSSLSLMPLEQTQTVQYTLTKLCIITKPSLHHHHF